MDSTKQALGLFARRTNPIIDVVALGKLWFENIERSFISQSRRNSSLDV